MIALALLEPINKSTFFAVTKFVNFFQIYGTNTHTDRKTYRQAKRQRDKLTKN